MPSAADVKADDTDVGPDATDLVWGTNEKSHNTTQQLRTQGTGASLPGDSGQGT